MRHLLMTAAFASLLCGTAIAGKPSSGGSPPPNPEVAYEVRSGNSNKLMVSNADGTNASTLYSSASPIRFDLAPRSQRQIAISNNSTTDPAILLLSYTQTGSGTFAASGAPIRLATARRNTNVDFSPDGTKLAFACNSNNIDSEQLCVYDLASGTTAVWGSASFYWDLAWFRGGASIAYSAPKTDDTTGDILYEITGQGMTPTPLLNDRGEIDFDAARTDPDALVLDYHDAQGNAFIGLWKNGSFLDPDLTHNTFAFYGELNCNDSELVYQGPPNKTPTWYIRDLTSGLTTKFGSQSDGWVQFWPTCS
jgi:hypothetical protein